MLTYNYSPPPPSNEHDALFDEAVEYIKATGKASATLMQRHFRIGFARAGSLLDELEKAGIVGPVNGAKPREILINHTDYQGNQVKVIPRPTPPEVKYEYPVTAKWNKTKYASYKSTDFDINLGIDENHQPVNFSLKKYGNLLIIGSQYTGAVDLLNNILTTSLATYSPDELRLIACSSVRGSLIVPNQASHLLVPVVVDSSKIISSLKWAIDEIEHRYKTFAEVGATSIDNYNQMVGVQSMPRVLIAINELNEILYYSPTETQDHIYRIVAQGRACGFHLIASTDYPSPRYYKEILANTPAKLVFKPTDKKIARDTGIPESANLTSPDEAILDTMFDGKTKLTITKVDVKKIYQEIFK